MRNKIKQIMKKEEGFTLVELLAVIVILGIIVAIAIPSIGRLIANADDDAVKAETVLILDAARLYEVQEEPIGAKDSGSSITVQDLIDNDFLELRESDINPETSTIFRNSDNELELDRKVIENSNT